VIPQPPQAPTAAPTTPRPRRSRLLWLGVAAALLAGGVAAGWRWWRPGPPRPRAAEPPRPAAIEDADVRQAVEEARAGVLAEPGSAVAWGGYGLTLLAHHFDAEADLCFAEAARLDADGPLWPFARGGVLLRRRDPAAALPFLRRAAELAEGPGQAPYRLALAETLLELRALDEAERIFREEWEAGPGDPRSAFGLGRLALERGDERAAEELLDAARHSPHARKQATGLLAGLARGRGQTADADDLEKLAAGLPEDAAWPDPLLEQVLAREAGRSKRGRDLLALAAQRRFRDIAEVHLRDVRERPTVSAYVNAGFSLVQARDFERALPLLRRAVELGPDSPTAHYVLALGLFEQAVDKAALREAAEQARRATELSPGHSRAFLTWGQALRRLGEPAAAVVPLRLGVQCEPGCFDLQLNLGEALLDAGQHGEARPPLENARRLAPADRRVAEALERLRQKGG
jgi:tetratricopeptide (TPR) repeat protein